MKYNIMGKVIVSVGSSVDQITLGFEDGVNVIIKAKGYIATDSDGRLRIRSTLDITTDKLELEAEG